jgi:hypothetical protein
MDAVHNGPSDVGRSAIHLGKEVSYIAHEYPPFIADMIKQSPQTVPKMIKGGAEKISTGYDSAVSGAEGSVGKLQQKTLDALYTNSVKVNDFYNLEVRGAPFKVKNAVSNIPDRASFAFDKGITNLEGSVEILQMKTLNALSDASTGVREFYNFDVIGSPFKIRNSFNGAMEGSEIAVGKFQQRTLDSISGKSAIARDIYNLNIKKGIHDTGIVIKNAPGKVLSSGNLERGLVGLEDAVGKAQAKTIMKVEDTFTGIGDFYQESVKGAPFKIRNAMDLEGIETSITKTQKKVLDSMYDKSVRASDFYNLKVKKSYQGKLTNLRDSVENAPSHIKKSMADIKKEAEAEWDSYTPKASKIVYPKSTVVDIPLRMIQVEGKNVKNLQSIKIKQIRPDEIWPEDIVKPATPKKVTTKKSTTGRSSESDIYNNDGSALSLIQEDAREFVNVRTKVSKNAPKSPSLEVVSPTMMSLAMSTNIAETTITTPKLNFNYMTKTNNLDDLVNTSLSDISNFSKSGQNQGSRQGSTQAQDHNQGSKQTNDTRLDFTSILDRLSDVDVMQDEATKQRNKPKIKLVPSLGSNVLGKKSKARYKGDALTHWNPLATADQMLDVLGYK